MRRFCLATVSVVVVAVAFAGCGGDSGAAPGSGFLEDASTSVPFKSTDLTPLTEMQNQMKEHAKKGDYKVKAIPPKEKTEKSK